MSVWGGLEEIENEVVWERCLEGRYGDGGLV